MSSTKSGSPPSRLRRAFTGLMLLAIVLACGSVVRAETETQEGAGPVPPSGGTAAYTVKIEGIDDKALHDLLAQSSLLFTLRDKPPNSVHGLRRRVLEDIERFNRILRSEAYYDASVSYTLEQELARLVRIDIALGPEYFLAAFEVVPKGCEDGGCAPTPVEEELGLTLGGRGRSADILAAEERARRWYRSRGHPFPAFEPLSVTADHKLLALTVTLNVTPGPARVMDAPVYSGAPEVDRRYLRALATWRSGEPYDIRMLEAYRRRLEETGLFTSARVVVEEAGPESPESAPLPVLVALVSAKARSIGAGVGYSTSEGPGAKVFWEHRNLLGADEDLRLRLEGAFIEQGIFGDFQKPAFIRTDQDLVASTALSRKTTDAFHSIGAEGQIGLEKRVSRHLRTGIGVLGETARISDEEGQRLSYLTGLPIILTYDTRNAALDPTKGLVLSARATPFAGFLETPIGFSRLELSGATYFGRLPLPGAVFALRAKVGSIVGAETEELPATRRFYAGGGGSVRGYEFERVGPLNDENDPLGGRSVVELGAELRLRLPADLGLVPFVEGGNVYDKSYPTFEEELFWAVGLGLRYYTAVGPLRLDVAVPMNRREGVDAAFQFYVSLGQAF